MFSRRMILRAWTADSWTVGILKPDPSLEDGFAKKCCGDGRLDAVVTEIRPMRAAWRRILLLLVSE